MYESESNKVGYLESKVRECKDEVQDLTLQVQQLEEQNRILVNMVERARAGRCPDCDKFLGRK